MLRLGASGARMLYHWQHIQSANAGPGRLDRHLKFAEGQSKDPRLPPTTVIFETQQFRVWTWHDAHRLLLHLPMRAPPRPSPPLSKAPPPRPLPPLLCPPKLLLFPRPSRPSARVLARLDNGRRGGRVRGGRNVNIYILPASGWEFASLLHPTIFGTCLEGINNG